jgi:hypothetical protein
MGVLWLSSDRIFQKKLDCAPTPNACVPGSIPIHSISKGCLVIAVQVEGLAIGTGNVELIGGAFFVTAGTFQV